MTRHRRPQRCTETSKARLRPCLLDTLTQIQEPELGNSKKRFRADGRHVGHYPQTGFWEITYKVDWFLSMDSESLPLT